MRTGGLTIVGGGTGALGRAVVERLVNNGHRVVVPARHPDAVQFSEAVTVLPCDLSDDGQVLAFVSSAADMGSISVLVNCSGGFAAGTAHEAGEGEVLGGLELNLLGPWRLSRAAARAMVERGAGGRIVNVVGRAAVEVAAEQAVYQVAKTALARLTQVMALELRGHGVTVNAVLPSTMDTPSNRAAMPRANHSRWVPPAEVAAAIEWLLSDEASAVSGALLPVYGLA